MRVAIDRRRVLGFAISTAVVTVSSGCAGLMSAAHPWARALPLNIPESALRARLSDQGLLLPLTQYWSAYAERRWSDRFKLEHHGIEVQEGFYVRYHDAAWIILSFDVVAVHAPDDSGRVRVDISALFQGPGTQDRREALVQDWWLQEGQNWGHVNTDPMLNGMRLGL